MSMSDWEIQNEEALEQLYQEHKERAIEEFTEERLRSFYLSHPDQAERPRAFLREAKALLPAHATPAQILAASASEVAIKSVFLQPLVNGLVHSETLAGLVTDMALRQTGVARFRDLLFEILTEVAGVDLRVLVRASASAPLWAEIQEVQEARNRALHRAESRSTAEAEQAIAVCSELLDMFHSTMLKRLGFHSHDGTSICTVRYCPDRFKT